MLETLENEMHEESEKYFECFFNPVSRGLISTSSGEDESIFGDPWGNHSRLVKCGFEKEYDSSSLRVFSKTTDSYKITVNYSPGTNYRAQRSDIPGPAGSTVTDFKITIKYLSHGEYNIEDSKKDLQNELETLFYF